MVVENNDLIQKSRFVDLFSACDSSTVELLPPGSGFAVASELWRSALAETTPDVVAKIRHAQLQGNPDWRLHIAEIDDKVACHLHRQEIEVYEIVAGSGILYSGPVAINESNLELISHNKLVVEAGDVFIVPEGYAHQLLRVGNEPLIIIFACPDAHLAEDRLIMPDICEPRRKILVDSDALPGAARDILFRAAKRVRIKTIFVANKILQMPDSEYISFELAEAGFDVADARIVEQVEAGDIVVTADIPLAAAVVEKGALAIDPRGQLYSAENIKERLFVRDFMADLRQSGATTGGPAPYDKKSVRAFAAQLDRLLSKVK